MDAKEYYRERLLLMVSMRRQGHTFAAIGRAAEISTDRARQVVYSCHRKRLRQGRKPIFGLYYMLLHQSEYDKWGGDPRRYEKEWREWLPFIQKQLSSSSPQ